MHACYVVHACCMWGEGGWGRKTLSLMFYQNGYMLNSLCQYLKVHEQRSWMKLNSVPLLLRTSLCYPTIHFGSRRPSVRNNVSNKQAHALFFQNAFTKWVHRASFLKLCLDQRLLPVMFWVQLRELLFLQKVFYLSNSWNVRGWTVPSKVQPVVEDRRSKNYVQSMSWKACSPDKLENPVVWANNASPMILNVRCRISLCGVLKIFHPCLCAMSKSPLLNGSAMFALLGTLSSIWCNWHLLCHVQWAPMMLLSGWCLPVPLMMACFDASLSHNWI